MGREATARLRGADRALLVAAEVPAYDHSAPVLQNALSEVLWHYGPAYELSSATQG